MTNMKPISFGKTFPNVSKVKILGIHWVSETRKLFNVNYSETVNKVRHLMYAHRSRNISLYARILFVKQRD